MTPPPKLATCLRPPSIATPAPVSLSRDFVHWTLAPMNWPVFHRTPDAREQADRYYLFFNQPCLTFGAVSDPPIGPWNALGGGDGLVMPRYPVKNVIRFDAPTFENTNGDLYMYWGTWDQFNTRSPYFQAGRDFPKQGLAGTYECLLHPFQSADPR